MTRLELTDVVSGPVFYHDLVRYAINAVIGKIMFYFTAKSLVSAQTSAKHG